MLSIRRILSRLTFLEVIMAPDSTGFDIISSQGIVRILISTTSTNLKNLITGLHLDAKAMTLHMCAVRHR